MLTKLISPILRIMYRESFSNKEAMDSIAANYSANLLGLGNAALPLGIKAMNELKKSGLSDRYTANDDMILFAVLNTTPIQHYLTY